MHDIYISEYGMQGWCLCLHWCHVALDKVLTITSTSAADDLEGITCT